MRLKSEEIEAKRNLILEKGRQLMSKQGYAGTGVSEIAKEVGMPKGSFFNYFESKEDFTVEMVRDYCDLSHKFMVDYLRSSKYSPIERLRKFYEENARWHAEIRKFESGCVLNGLSQEVSDYNAVIARSVKNCLESLIKELVNCLEEAQRQGELSTDHDPTELAIFIDNSWRGVLTTSKSVKNEKAIQAFHNYIFNHILK